MKRLAAKLGFVHRALWQRDPAYRWAVLLGPPPLLGCALAALAWLAVHRISADSSAAQADAPWATWTRPVPQADQPFTEAPAAPLPVADASGRFPGFQPGWAVTVEAMSVDATLDPDVTRTVLGGFTLDRPTIPLSRLVAAGPATGLFAGLAQGYFVARAAGVYAFSVQLARASTEPANCLLRLASAHHAMVRNVRVNAGGQAVLTYPPTELRLEPGLFGLGVVASCWRGSRVAGEGEVTLMVRHPGEATLQPATGDEVVRPAPR